MSAKNAQRTVPANGKHSPRAQRRAAQRDQLKEVRRQPAGRRISMPQVIGGLITLAAVAAIVVYALLRSNGAARTAGTTSVAAVTIAADLHPVSNMLAVGTRAPNFTLHGVNGGTYSLAAQHGHPVLLEFFAVWCPHCQHEAPIIQKLKNAYGGTGLRIWSILANPYGPNYDNSYGQDTSPATAADVRYFAGTYGEHVPQLIDPTFKVVNKYGINGYPGIYLIDGSGIIRYSNSGDQPLSTLKAAVQRAMKQ